MITNLPSSSKELELKQKAGLPSCCYVKNDNSGVDQESIR